MGNLPRQLALPVAAAVLLSPLGEPQQSAEQLHLAECVAEAVPDLLRLRKGVDEGLFEGHAPVLQRATYWGLSLASGRLLPGCLELLLATNEVSNSGDESPLLAFAGDLQRDFALVQGIPELV